jgi:hypothetical protein
LKEVKPGAARRHGKRGRSRSEQTEASELSKLGRDPCRETTEESSGQPAVIVDHDAGYQLVQIWKHSSHIALAGAFANARLVCVGTTQKARLAPRFDCEFRGAKITSRQPQERQRRRRP